jgi:hypothetical protein
MRHRTDSYFGHENPPSRAPNEETLNQAYIVDALRTPVGRRRGALSGVHAADLGAHVLKHLVERNAIPSAATMPARS